jgi:hypothetical protein
MKNKLKGVNVLISGSQKFDDQSFVFQTLETFFTQTNGNIRRVFTSKFAGACEFARVWVDNKNDKLDSDSRIEVSEFTFDGFLQKKNQSLYDQLDIPEYAIQNAKFFQEGKEKLMANGVNLVLAFPNPEGILGASTRNIARFASLAEIQVFDCSALLQMVNSYRNEVSQTVEQEVQAAHKEQSGLGFHNRHPGMR